MTVAGEGIRTWQPAPWTVEELIELKAGRRVAVVLPALDEQATVGEVVRALHPLTRPVAPGRAAGRAGVPLVDELIVLDGGSTDRTAELATAAGARVVDRETALPGLAVRPGKGEVLWRSLAVTDADLIVFADADLVDVDPGLVVGLLGPLLTCAQVHLVKGFYRRPLRLETQEWGTGGGRVTELVARPLLARFVPQLSAVIQPLGGEYAATAELLRSLPFAGGYGVEIGLLIDTVARRGEKAIAQVDLGVRKHRHRTLLELGVMSQQILATVLARVGVDPEPMPVELVQFEQRHGRWTARRQLVGPQDRPPMGEFLTGTHRSLPQAVRHGTIDP